MLPTAAARALTTLSGPVGLALTYSTRNERGEPAGEVPKRSPASAMRSARRRTKAGA